MNEKYNTKEIMKDIVQSVQFHSNMLYRKKQHSCKAAVKSLVRKNKPYVILIQL